LNWWLCVCCVRRREARKYRRGDGREIERKDKKDKKRIRKG